jgi:hypothetical protein
MSASAARPPRPTEVLRLAALGQAVTALVLAQRWSTSNGVSAMVLLGTVLIVSLAGAWALWMRDAFETKLFVGAAAGATAVGALLSTTVGTPGSEGGEISVSNVLLTLFPCLVLGLLGIDTWRRTRPADV